MNIKLVDVDSTIPNLALMKLSTFHKSLGDEVSFERLGISYYPNERIYHTITTDGFDKVYLSAIFEDTINHVHFDMWSDLSKCEFGGTGIDLSKKLPEEVDRLELDYSIYPDNDTAYGFISRGCNRKCYFCVVPKKEGKVHQVENDLKKIIGDFKKVKFMDNNFLQLPNHLEILNWLAEKQIKCQFNQGLDFRLLDEQNSEALSKVNYMGEFIFAFDDWHYRKFYESKLPIINWMKPWQAKFYVYCNPKMPLYETVKRIEWLKERKLLPYVMRDKSCFDDYRNEFFTDLAAYANQPAFFKKMDFRNFLMKRHKDMNRIELHTKMYEEAML